MKFSRLLHRDKEKSANRPPPRNAAANGAAIGEQRRQSKPQNVESQPPVATDHTHEFHLRKEEGGHSRVVEKGPEEPWPLDFIETGNRRTATPSSEGMVNLPPLQVSNDDEARARGLAPLHEEAVDPDSFDLAPPPQADREKAEQYSLERRSLFMFSKTHLRIIFQDFRLLRKFTAFLVEYRPESVPLLVYHLDARKALAALKYSNAVSDCLRPVESLAFTRAATPKSINEDLRRKTEASFNALANDDLPAWITAVWMRTVEVSIRRRINGSLPAQLRDMSEGLAETFVLSDPSRHDNPILFASEEFCKMTQYGIKYVVGRNCRIFQGPKSDPNGVRRLREKLENAQLHYEPILNYRRDGSPFMNLLMITPLLDGNGRVRYYLGAQIDTSGLLKDFYGFEHLQNQFDSGDYPGDSDGEADSSPWDDEDPAEDGLKELSELFNHDELETIRQHGGRLHHPDLQEPSSTWKKRQRLVLQPDTNAVGGDSIRVGPDGDIVSRWEANGEHYGDFTRSIRSHGSHSERIMDPRSERVPSSSNSAHSAQTSFAAQHGGHLGGVYDHYLLVRPAPYLRILFASPSLRLPGMVQSNIMDRIGGSAQLRQQIEQALCRGQSVTAKVKWNSSPRTVPPQQPPDGSIPQVAHRNRWFHATPLLGRNGEVGVWMVVLVDEEKDGSGAASTQAAPSFVANGSFVGSGMRSGGAAMSLRSTSGKGSMHDTDGGSIVTVVTGHAPHEPDREAAVDGLRPPPSRGATKRFGIALD